VKLRILLVDDHELMREGLRAMIEKEPDLELAGEAASGRDAVARARALAPDLVVMDVAMKDVNGIEATRQILAERPGTRVVALSSHADRRYVTSILRAGASGYVLKANAYAELRRAIDAARVGRSFVSPQLVDGVVDAVRTGAGEEGSVFERLGSREREVLQLLAEGLSSPEIGRRLSISTSTVETHRRNLMRKLDLHSVADLTKYAVREGLTALDG